MFDLSGITGNLQQLPERYEKALMGYGNTVAQDMAGEARRDRPWTDRTAQAKQRITAYCKRTETGVRIYLAHGVDYGAYLEFAHEKKYAIIYPTLRKKGPEAMRALPRILEGGRRR